MESDLEVYNFGETKRSPKQDLKDPFDAMRAYHDLNDRVKRLSEYSKINGRQDHFIHNLDVLFYSMKEGLYEIMVIREALTGNKVQPRDYGPDSKMEKEKSRIGLTAQQELVDILYKVAKEMHGKTEEEAKRFVSQQLSNKSFLTLNRAGQEVLLNNA